MVRRYLAKAEKLLLDRSKGTFKDGKPFKQYFRLIQRSDYTVYSVPTRSEKIIAAWDSIICTQSIDGSQLFIYPNYRKSIFRYRIKINPSTLPDLMPGSKFQEAFIIPFMRERRKDVYEKSWRLVIVTDKCQIYHNFPRREANLDGFEQYRDIVHFEESVVWDVPGHRYPSKNTNCKPYEYYNPCLPELAYSFHPPITNGTVGRYGNCGFSDHTEVPVKGKLETVSRFYFPNRNAAGNPFCYMGGYEPDYKMTLVGSYRSNKEVGLRNVLFASSDGGRSWFAKYEFSDEGEYHFRQGNDEWGKNYGNILDGTLIKNNCKGKLSLVKRKLQINDQPSILYEDVGEILSIENTCPIRVVMKNTHGLENGNIVAITGQTDNNDWKWLLSELHDPKGGKVVFKAAVVDDRTIELYECVSATENSIPCRHIHHINRVKDGWIMGTGEIFPNGWLYYIQAKAADTYTIFDASEEFVICRLNNKPSSVQRTTGAILRENGNELLLASDHDLLDRPVSFIADQKRISRSSTGIYRGTIENIDDFSSFTCSLELSEPVFFFKELDNAIISIGQRGEFAISFDQGKNWSRTRLDRTRFQYLGRTFDFFVIGDCLIRLK